MSTADAPRPSPEASSSEPSTARAEERASWHTPYLVVLALGLVAALVVVVQLWGYRDELRTILTGAPN